MQFLDLLDTALLSSIKKKGASSLKNHMFRGIAKYAPTLLYWVKILNTIPRPIRHNIY